jgi:glycine/D-amino acid oxidase-like deaminating enzyme
LHEELAAELAIQSYRRIPVLSVTPGRRSKRTKDLCPWLDGDGIEQTSWMDRDGGAQVAPLELCTKLVEAAVEAGATFRKGSVEGIETAADGDGEGSRVSAVQIDGELVPCKAFVCTMGPWAACAQDWFGIPIPMTGIKSTSIVFRAEPGKEVEPFALFCDEDDRYGTHLEVYPRNSGEVYLCGIGGSEYVDGDRLRAGEYPPGEVHADPARVTAAASAFAAMSKTLGGGEPDVTQACMRPCPPDAMPYMGRVPNHANAFMSAGHNCWGILWAPVSGKAMSELILDGKSSCVDLTAFDPARFAPRATGGRGRKRGNEPVGEQW